MRVPQPGAGNNTLLSDNYCLVIFHCFAINTQLPTQNIV